MLRRTFIASAICLAASLTTPAIAGQTALVMVVNLHCDRCAQVNLHLDRITKLAAAKGMSFMVAPVAWEGQSYWPDKVYYAFRDLYPGSEAVIREVLYDAIQTRGQRFATLSQVIAWLDRESVRRQLTAYPAIKLSTVADYASEDQVTLSEMKAGNLMNMSGATAVPAFIWVSEGEVKDAVYPGYQSENSAMGLVNAVLTKLR